LAVVATLSKGHDLDYIWKQVDVSLAREGAGYYIQASETGREPPGRWWGPGAHALGLKPGQVVERKPYDLLFGERKAPDGTQLGRPPGSGRKAAGIYAALLSAEPHATAERKRELRLEATRRKEEPRGHHRLRNNRRRRPARHRTRLPRSPRTHPSPEFSRVLRSNGRAADHELELE
jgi:hypothetical protein